MKETVGCCVRAVWRWLGLGSRAVGKRGTCQDMSGTGEPPRAFPSFACFYTQGHTQIHTRASPLHLSLCHLDWEPAGCLPYSSHCLSPSFISVTPLLSVPSYSSGLPGLHPFLCHPFEVCTKFKFDVQLIC